MPHSSKIGVFVAATLLGVSWTAAVGGSDTPPEARPNSGSNVPLRGQDPDLKRPPLTCRITQVGKTEQKTALAKISPFILRPELLTPTLLRNPLIADELEIQVENTSGGDLEIFTEGVDKSPFWAEALIRDQKGQRITFQRTALISMSRSTYCPEGAMRLRLKAGQVVKQRLWPWELLAFEDALRPGRYTIRAQCFYFLAPKDKGLQIESEPLEVSFTTSQIREWSHVRDLHNAMPFVPVLEP